MIRTLSGVAAGVVSWMILVTLINLAIRFAWPDYKAAEPLLDFGLAMMIARLLESGVSSLVAGFIAGWVERGQKAGWISGLILLLLFLKDHIDLWERFPVWYHLVFLISLPLLGWAGSKLKDKVFPS